MNIKWVSINYYFGGVFMRKENVKVIIWGLGAMGRGMAEMLLKEKRGRNSRCSCDRDPKIW